MTRIYIAPPPGLIVDDPEADIAELIAADVILSDEPVDPVTATLAEARGLSVLPLSTLVGDSI